MSTALGVGLLIANLLILVANVGILGLTVKLYSEFAKDRSMAARVKEQRDGA